MSDQFLSTSRLGSVMKLISLGRQTGLLQVMRGQGATREEGRVQFVDGDIAMASVGQLSGSAAVAVLQNWGESYYLFLDGVNQMQSGRVSDRLSWGMRDNDSLPPAGSSSGAFPAGPFGPPSGPFGSQPGASGSQPGLTSSQPGLTSSQPGASGSNPGLHTGGFGAAPGTSYPPGGYPAPGASFPPRPVSGPLPSAGTSGAFAAAVATDLKRVPRRTPPPANMASLPLERRERQLLLLIDGRRTVTDLVRLTRRGDDEIQHMLAHLFSLGLVE